VMEPAWAGSGCTSSTAISWGRPIRRRSCAGCADHRPDLFPGTDKFLLWGGWLGFLLGGSEATSGLVEPLTRVSTAAPVLLATRQQRRIPGCPPR